MFLSAGNPKVLQSQDKKVIILKWKLQNLFIFCSVGDHALLTLLDSLVQYLCSRRATKSFSGLYLRARGPPSVRDAGPSPSRMKAKSRLISLILHFIILFLAAVLRKKAFQYSPTGRSSLGFCANVAPSIEVVSACSPRLGNSCGTLACFLGLCFLSCVDAFINKCRDPARNKIALPACPPGFCAVLFKCVDRQGNGAHFISIDISRCHRKPQNYKGSRVQSHPAWINRSPGRRGRERRKAEDHHSSRVEGLPCVLII